MKLTLISCAVIMAALFATTPIDAADLKEFDSEKMLSDLEAQLKLSSDKLNKLKPALDAKSKELKSSINESVDKGFMQLDKLTTDLDSATREAEANLREALSSEEMQKLKDYLNKIDGEAIKQIRDELVAQLSDLLKLTEAQIAKVKPILEDSFDQLGKMLDQLQREGVKSAEKFQSQFEALTKDLKQRLRHILDAEQIKTLETNREDLKESIRRALNLT